MRFYAGFLDMAKALRYEENAEDGGKLVIDDTMRAGYLAAIDSRAKQDAIYKIGAQFGWWGIKRPDRTEEVFENGISDAHKKTYLADYHAKYPPKPVVAPPTI
jgi:hypothetical protein